MCAPGIPHAPLSPHTEAETPQGDTSALAERLTALLAEHGVPVTIHPSASGALVMSLTVRGGARLFHMLANARTPTPGAEEWIINELVRPAP